MKIGQYVSLKDSANYTEVFDAPEIGAKSEGFTAGYLGQITALDIYEIVADNPEDAHIYTKILNKNNEVKYLDNKDIRFYDYSDTAPSGVTLPTTPPTTGNNSGSTLDKILGVFTGLLGVFGKTKPITTTPAKPDPTNKTGDNTDPTTPNTNTQKTFAEWFAANWWWAILAIIIVPGGIIWAIVAAAKADKKKALQMSTPPKV